MTKSWQSNHNPKIKLSPKELLKISREISRDFAPSITTNKVSELVLLPVDPYHLYAYWNFGDDIESSIQKAPAAVKLCLRIYWRPDQNVAISENKLWFDIPVNNPQTQLKVRLPIDASDYSAAIGLHHPKHRFTALINSNTVHVPRGRMVPHRRKSRKKESDLQTQTTAEKRENSPSPVNMQLYDEVLIDTKILNILFEKGIDASLTLEQGYSDNEVPAASHYARKNASGQGNLN